VLLFLIAFYRFLGVVAALGLIAYATFFFALLKLIPITLTLPGIAGLILTIGVAADSNIVIFERIKEELRAGRTLVSAISIGYRRGISTIIDANVVILLTSFILFVLATSGVKGFAFTLGVGTLVSLLTAVVFTQALLGSMINTKMLRRGMGITEDHHVADEAEKKSRWHFDFMGASKWLFVLSAVILLIGGAALASRPWTTPHWATTLSRSRARRSIRRRSPGSKRRWKMSSASERTASTAPASGRPSAPRWRAAPVSRCSSRCC
jgi:SecD/SecF fusion protein